MFELVLDPSWFQVNMLSVINIQSLLRWLERGPALGHESGSAPVLRCITNQLVLLTEKDTESPNATKQDGFLFLKM